MPILRFPDHFIWGTSTAAAQVETASDHIWKGFAAKDGYVFDRTTDHEKRREEDAQYIAMLGNMYRCGVDWARLQSQANAPFNTHVVHEYQAFFQDLRARGVEIMFVIHHFTHPLWFEATGGWLNKENIPVFIDFAKQCIHHFGEFVSNWNTFNEPNVYALNGYLLGNFPPQQKSYSKANTCLQNMGLAHDQAYTLLKKAFPEKPVGISLNTVYFKGKNILGALPAAFADWWFHRKASRYFAQVDYWGLSYYAYILMDPAPITEIDRPGKLAELGIPHDKMWGYYPDGLSFHIRRIYAWYKKPILITENGICTDDPQVRIQSLRDYLARIHHLIEKERIPILGYMHWSTWDNFEWNIGPTYRFGLVRVDWDTMERTITPAATFYESIVRSNGLEV